LLIDEKPMLVKGICYSPIPINESVYFAPYGDYFTADYSFIWLRDLPLIKAMGVNVVRTYGWQPKNDHTAFLDALASHDLYLMATYYMGDSTETPVDTPEARSLAVKGFASEVEKYADHPAILFWSFGNELNGVWNGYLQALGKSGPEQCDWDERYDDLGGCWIHKGTLPPKGSKCYDSSYCVYKKLFSFINDAAVAAHAVADVLVVSAFADVDGLYDKILRAGDFAMELDAWTAQVYRGSSFGDFFEGMGNSTSKPVLLTEYGVDAYHDACGEGKHTPCFNTLGDDSTSFEDESAQAAFAMNLTLEIMDVASSGPECAKAVAGRNGDAGSAKCTCLGGFLMSWADEYWKGSKAQASCPVTQGHRGFDPKKCQEKAHVTCGNWDTSVHDLCGYFLDASPDHYVNEEWFGITAPTQCERAIDSLRPRMTYWKMRELWTGERGKDVQGFESCKELVENKCIALGDGGGDTILDWLRPSPHKSGGPQTCSGHGRCTTDWSECGAGTSDEVSTPCCSCEFGFAGAGCADLDARVYVALGALGVVTILLVAMVTNSIATACNLKRMHPDLSEKLLG